MNIRKLESGLVVIGGGHHVEREDAHRKQGKRHNKQRRRNGKHTSRQEKVARNHQKAVTKREDALKRILSAKPTQGKATGKKTPQNLFKPGPTFAQYRFSQSISPYYGEKRFYRKLVRIVAKRFTIRYAIPGNPFVSAVLIAPIIEERRKALPLPEKVARALERKFGPLGRKPTATEIAEYVHGNSRVTYDEVQTAVDMRDEEAATAYSWT